MPANSDTDAPPGETKQQRYHRRNKERCNEKDHLRMQKKRAHEKEMKELLKDNEAWQLARDKAQNRAITPEPKLMSSSPMTTPEGHCAAAITLDPGDNLPDDFFALDDDDFSPPIQRTKTKKPQIQPQTNIDFGPFTNSPIHLALDDSDYEAEMRQYEIFTQLKTDVDLWASAFSGHVKWGDLDDSFNNTIKENTIQQWTERVWTHAAEGRTLLRRLQNMDGELPPAMYLIRELWRLQVELVEIVVRGITCLELQANFVRDGPVNLINRI